MAHLGPGVLFAEQVSIEIGHLPVPLVCEAPHQLPVTHVVELLPLLLGLAALLKTGDSLQNTQTTEDLTFLNIFGVNVNTVHSEQGNERMFKWVNDSWKL